MKLFILLREISWAPLHKLMGKKKSYSEYSTSKIIAFNISMYKKVRKHLRFYCRTSLASQICLNNLELLHGKKDYSLASKFTGFSKLR